MITLNEQEVLFVERIGLSVQQDGMSRITGRIWALILLVGGPVSSADIASALRISKGSVSTNTRQLEAFGVIERRAVPGERQDHFGLAANPYATLLRRYMDKFQRDASVVREALDGCGDRAGARDRLDLHLQFYEELTDAYERAAERLDHGAAPKRAER